ncbi:MAG TPA: hypothetical protein VGF12_12680 [Roseateles sp.]
MAEAAPLIKAYALLGLAPAARGRVDEAQALSWHRPDLSGCAVTWLAAPGSAPLLRLIELPAAAARPTRLSHGWMALEVLVRDVDALGDRLLDSPFEIVGPPADLAVSPAIRAMQVVGPAGEMLYLTQVKQPVPPFDLPLSAELEPAQDVGPLFIGVMSVPDREAAIAACAAMTPRATLRFDTRVTVLSRALDRPLDHPWPVATLQWAGRSLFEIDEVQDAHVCSPTRNKPPDGLAWLTLHGATGMQELAPGVWVEGA